MGAYQPKIGIIGKGRASVGLAVLLTSHGFPTVIAFPRDEVVKEFNNDYRYLVKKELITEEEANTCASYLICDGTLNECEVIFECGDSLAEKEMALQHILSSAGQVKSVISVTTALLPDEIASQCPALKEKLVVCHVAAMAHLIPLAELMPAENEEAFRAAKELLEELDRKIVVLKKPVRGFLASRIYYALCREVLYLTENGFGAARDVDTATMYSILPRYTAIGPFEGSDNASIDLTVTTTGHLFPLFVNAQAAPAILTDAVANNRLGASSGAGIYDYTEEAKEDLEDRIYAPWLKFFKAKIPAGSFRG